MKPATGARRTKSRWQAIREPLGAALLILVLGFTGCHPEAVAGSPEETEPETGTGMAAETIPSDAAATETSPGRPVNRDELIEAGETGLLPILVPGVGPLAEPGGCDFDDPFSSCQ